MYGCRSPSDPSVVKTIRRPDRTPGGSVGSAIARCPWMPRPAKGTFHLRRTATILLRLARMVEHPQRTKGTASAQVPGFLGRLAVGELAPAGRSARPSAGTRSNPEERHPLARAR